MLIVKQVMVDDTVYDIYDPACRASLPVSASTDTLTWQAYANTITDDGNYYVTDLNDKKTRLSVFSDSDDVVTQFAISGSGGKLYIRRAAKDALTQVDFTQIASAADVAAALASVNVELPENAEDGDVVTIALDESGNKKLGCSKINNFVLENVEAFAFYYTPHIDDAGNLSFTPNRNELPAITDTFNVKGETAYEAAVRGGYTGSSEDFDKILAAAGDKADKKVPANVGNIATLDEKGNLADSGKNISQVGVQSDFRESNENSAAFIKNKPHEYTDSEIHGLITAKLDEYVPAAIAEKLNRTSAVNEEDTNYAGYMSRGQSLNAQETTPTVNGTIAWQYE